MTRPRDTNDAERTQSDPAQILDEFQSSLDRGEEPRVEEFLGRASVEVRPSLLRKLLQIWVDTSKRLEQVPPRVEHVPTLLAEYPEIVYSVLGAMEPTRDTLSMETDSSADVGNEGPLPGRIGRYRILRLLGKGSFGRVFLAFDEELERDVAIKIPISRKGATLEQSHAFLREARLLAKLDHPGIVSVYDAGIDDSRRYLVSRYIRGQSLAESMAEFARDRRRSAEIIAAIADAIQYAHARGIIHRDLKPANILLDEKGHPCVSDFGLALPEIEQPERAGEIAGTPSYMSPEQVRGESHRLDGRTDIWSLGVILYELLTARKPFRGATTTELIDEILHREPKPPRQFDEQIPPELESICLHCLRKPLAERCRSAADVASAMRAFLGDSTPESRAIGRLGRRAAVGTLALGAMGTLAFFTQGVWRRHPEVVSVKSLKVTQFRGESLESLGDIESSSDLTREGDRVRLHVDYDGPAYCYVLSLSPDGAVERIYPDHPRAKPARIRQLTIPVVASHLLGLLDGTGLQAFVVLVSGKELPSYADFLTTHGACDWPSRQWASHIWRYSRNTFTSREPASPAPKEERGLMAPSACDSVGCQDPPSPMPPFLPAETGPSQPPTPPTPPTPPAPAVLQEAYMAGAQVTAAVQDRNPPEAFLKACQFYSRISDIDDVEAIAFPVYSTDFGIPDQAPEPKG